MTPAEQTWGMFVLGCVFALGGVWLYRSMRRRHKPSKSEKFIDEPLIAQLYENTEPPSLGIPISEPDPPTESKEWLCPRKGCSIAFNREIDLFEHYGFTGHNKTLPPGTEDDHLLRRVSPHQDPMSAVVGHGFARCDVCGEPVEDLQTVGRGTSVAHAYHFQGHNIDKKKPPVGVV